MVTGSICRNCVMLGPIRMTCPPKTDPGIVLVFGPVFTVEGGRYGEEAFYAGADYSEAA